MSISPPVSHAIEARKVPTYFLQPLEPRLARHFRRVKRPTEQSNQAVFATKKTRERLGNLKRVAQRGTYCKRKRGPSDPSTSGGDNN